jgi:Tol biopolymer transport system component/DNA-binding winged helix-turn-helix (wHTH) protein
VTCGERVKSLTCQELAAEVNYTVHPLLLHSRLYCMAREVERQVATPYPFPLCARFDQFHVDLTSGILQRSGVRVPVQSQPLQVLRLLLEAEGNVVTRDELRKVLWAEDTFVDFELGVNTAVKKLRQALADPAERPKFIETLPRIGYRFLFPVEWVTENGKGVEKAGNSAAAGGMGVASERTASGFSSTGTWKWLAVGGAILLAVGCIGVWRFVQHRRQMALPPTEVVPLTSFSGFEYDPAISPDGNQVAFGLLDKESGIYTTVIGGEKSFRVTDNFGHHNFGDCCPRWSPDGRQIAYVHGTDDGDAIYVTPALGGTQHRVYEGLSNSTLDWSPDGKFLAITESHENKTHSLIALLALADLSMRPLTSPSGQELDYGPAFSPDGSTVAFVRSVVAGMVSDLYVIPTAGGEPKRVTFDHRTIFGQPSWTPDGRELVYTSDLGGLPSLWRVSVSGGKPERVAGVGTGAECPSVSRTGHQLVYQQKFLRFYTGRLNLKDETHLQGPSVKVISWKGQQFRPNFSPDGKRIAFESDRSGDSEIWACDIDGSNCGELTTLHGVAGAPRWSPDGRTIAFEFHTKEHGEIYLLEVGGGAPRLLATIPGSDNGGPSWSRDGKSLYFYSDRGGSFQIWKMQLNGGTPVQVTKNGGVFAAESMDGRFIYFSKYEAPGIWKMPIDGGEESRLLADQGGQMWWNWALARNGIYFLQDELNFFDFATGKRTSIYASDKPLVMGLAVSPDGKSILYPQIDIAESSIMLVKNFR